MNQQSEKGHLALLIFSVYAHLIDLVQYIHTHAFYYTITLSFVLYFLLPIIFLLLSYGKSIGTWLDVRKQK